VAQLNMPQPLWKVVRTGLGVSLAPDLAAKQPELAALVARAIALCANSDYNLGMAFIGMLKTEAAPAFAIYDALRRSYSKTQALRAASKIVLNEQDYRIFEALLELFAQDETQRNKFAHWIWAYCEKAPDYLVLVDPIDPLRWKASVAHIPPGSVGTMKTRLKETLSIAGWMERASCYSKPELEHIVERFADTNSLIAAFRNLMDYSIFYAVPEDELRSNLLNQPRLAQTLLQLDRQSG
jgi:hypothetical protein